MYTYICTCTCETNLHRTIVSDCLRNTTPIKTETNSTPACPKNVWMTRYVTWTAVLQHLSTLDTKQNLYKKKKKNDRHTR